MAAFSFGIACSTVFVFDKDCSSFFALIYLKPLLDSYLIINHHFLK
jgi:hypothetical protein